MTLIDFGDVDAYSAEIINNLLDSSVTPNKKELKKLVDDEKVFKDIIKSENFNWSKIR